MAKLYIGDSQGTPAIIKIEEVPKKKFGASVDTWIGDLDENGVLSRTTWTGALNFVGVKEIARNGLKYAFYGNAGITSVDLSSLTTVDDNGLYYAFYDCIGLTSVDLSSLTSVKWSGLYYAFHGRNGLTSVDLSSLTSAGIYGLQAAFRNCTGLTSVDISSLTTVEGSGLYNAFYGCTGLTSVDLSSLTTIASNGLSGVFQNCTGLTSVDLSSLTSVKTNGLESAFYGCTGLVSASFPSLTDVQRNSFGASTYNGMLYNCTALTEIHFRADMQATIEAMSKYADKWGAKNATIYFDLIGTITVNGVAYSRNEPNSIRVDGTKTFVAWKDASDNIVYTNAMAEPAVDTPVYSDQGTTQVGTVSEVA